MRTSYATLKYKQNEPEKYRSITDHLPPAVPLPLSLPPAVLVKAKTLGGTHIFVLCSTDFGR